MKIKTITCHDVYNVGASLQAYALQTYLTSLGNDVEIIDYKPDYLSNHYNLKAISNPVFDKPLVREAYLLAKLPGRVKSLKSERKRNFDSFREQYLKLTKRYSSVDELRQNPPEADLYFAGSDQIWNTFFKNGKDPAFYLDFGSDGIKRASYAASFATETIPSEYTSVISQWLEKLDYISVRESSGLNILKSLGISNGVQVLDPVFLLNKKSWESFDLSINTKNDYVLVYDFDNNQTLREIAQKISSETDCNIYSIQSFDYADKCFNQSGPIEFLKLVYNAKYIVSNSFHATAFSIIFGKQFWVLNRDEAINTRMRDLTKSLGIFDRIVSKEDEVIIESEINYNDVYKRLNIMIDLSKEYIYKVLNGVNND